MQKDLNVAIEKTKANAWQALCEEVDGDIWGKGYIR